MTTTRERMSAINEYLNWREEREIEGQPSGFGDYERYLIAQEPIEKLAEITALYEELDANPTSDDVRTFGWNVIRALLNTEQKELEQ